MAETVNQCLLSQTDFDFMTKANLVTDLTNQFEMASANFSVNLFVTGVAIAASALVMVFAVLMRKKYKLPSNVLLFIAFIAATAMALSSHKDFSNLKKVDVQLYEAKTELKTMEKSDVEIFDACHHPDAILKLAPNRDEPDFESSYKPVVSVE